MLAAMFSGLNLGYRLMLPVLPFALMIAGQGAASVVTFSLREQGRGEPSAGTRPWGAAIAGVLLAWLVIDSLASAPSHLAYFNQLINRDRDYEALVDSNLDWGQDLIALREWQQANNVTDRLNLAYFGTARPQAYGVIRQTAAGFFAERFRPGDRWLHATRAAAGTLRHQRERACSWACCIAVGICMKPFQGSRTDRAGRALVFDLQCSLSSDRSGSHGRVGTACQRSRHEIRWVAILIAIDRQVGRAGCGGAGYARPGTLHHARRRTDRRLCARRASGPDCSRRQTRQ